SATDEDYKKILENREFRMMRHCFVSVANIFRRSGLLRAALCLAVALLVGCAAGDGSGPKNPPSIKPVDLAVAGQTVTKARTAGSAVVMLEQRLTSIFEDGPQRTLAILQSDGHTVQPYMPPPGWSVVDFAMHPSGDISSILSTAREVRIVRLDPYGSIRTDPPVLDAAPATD